MTVKENLAYLCYFGFQLTFWKTLNTVFKKSKGKLAWKIHEINNDVIERYIKKVCPNTYHTFAKEHDIELEQQDVVIENLGKDSALKNNCIWTMWWQGEENAPELVKTCIASMRENSNGHPVIVLDESNYQEYIQLPREILIRYENGMKDDSYLKKCVVDRTRISDIIRCALLSYYGGIWCDATIFVSAPVSASLFTDKWSTLGQDDLWYIGQGKWSSFFMGCQAGDSLLKFIYRMHIEYFMKKEYWVHYLLMDYFIDIAYKEASEITIMIDNVKTDNKKCLTISRKYDEPVDIDEFNTFMSEQHFHKLSWRWWGNDKGTKVKVNTSEGKLTWFGYLYNFYIQKDRRVSGDDNS